jgi:SAM-dependent methyltransferase
MTCLLLNHQGLREKSDADAGHDFIGGISEKLGLRALRDALHRNASGRVLEVGGTAGSDRAHYPAGCEVIGVDWNRANLLAFEDETFDTVTASLSLCRFENQAILLREMSRVCKPHGRIVLLEHGRCQPSRDPLELMRRAGLQILHSQGTFFGMVHVIEARPAPRN